jgi:hypothetical protein
MLQIRAEQMLAFEQAALRRFEDEMVAHSRDFSPTLCEIIGEDQLRVALRQAMARAAGYGFTCRGPLRLFIEMMFLCGSAFDSDPQYPGLRKILLSPDDEMDRAERIHEGFLDYLERVSGPGAINVRSALKHLLTFARSPMTFSANAFQADMLREMRTAFPQKAKYVGEEGLVALIHEGIAEAHKYGLSSLRAQAMIVVLMFAFGHGCTSDPLYPWISRTLTDARIIDAPSRAQRLERKAVTWLEHVVARNEKAQT